MILLIGALSGPVVAIRFFQLNTRLDPCNRSNLRVPNCPAQNQHKTTKKGTRDCSHACNSKQVARGTPGPELFVDVGRITSPGPWRRQVPRRHQVLYSWHLMAYPPNPRSGFAAPECCRLGTATALSKPKPCTGKVQLRSTPHSHSESHQSSRHNKSMSLSLERFS